LEKINRLYEGFILVVIGIDVDGVLRDFCEGLTKVLREHYPQYIKKDFVEIKNWNFKDDFNCTREDIKQIYRHDYAKEIMGNSNPIYGAIEQMYDLFEWGKKEGHSFVCVTSQKPDIRHHTLSWLGKYGLNFDTIYFTRGRHKWRTPVDYLVDDSPENFDNWVRGRGMKEGYIMMDQIYNQESNPSYRIKELWEVKDIIDDSQE
jgi:5'(3')-deoxyribonucleotidase|tara:strand:- start:1621 stop:2232 length:612 start_codon:yes stop_codon:yes gene_type:complete